MNLLQKIFSCGIITLSLIGCETQSFVQKYKEGLVISEVGGSNSPYVLVVKTDEGNYSMTLINHTSKPISALKEAIVPHKARIKFKTNQVGTFTISEDYFSKDLIGSIPSSAIEILPDSTLNLKPVYENLTENLASF